MRATTSIERYFIHSHPFFAADLSILRIVWFYDYIRSRRRGDSFSLWPTGAYPIGKALAGRAAGILAMILLFVTPMYFAQAHVLEAEGPATAFLFLTVGSALMWWKIQRVKGG